MKKLFIALLPLLAACNSATNTQPNEETVSGDTIITTTAVTEPVEEKTEEETPLQEIKWNGIKEMTDASFKTDVLASSTVTLVDFNATWCGPCKQQKPILDKLVKEYAGKINFASVDVDQCPQTAQQYKISSIPTLAFYKNAKQGTSTIGLTPYEDLKAQIDNALKTQN